MDSLHRFSIEHLTSPNHVPSSKIHPGWNGVQPSTVYNPMPTYGQTATSEDKMYPWKSNSVNQDNVVTKHYRTEDTGSKINAIPKDSCFNGHNNQRQHIDELKSPLSSKVSSENAGHYRKSYCNTKHPRIVDDETERQIQDGGHLGGKTKASAQEEQILDVVESDKSEVKERTSSESQEEDDGNGKPEHSYIALISMSILASPEKKLVLSDIYQYIMDNFQYYNNQERAWRNSIRHNLSLNECFIKAGRAENGKGNYWAIHPACLEDFSKGDYRRRHARRRARGGPYSDISVSSLPYNYRCNIGYVPMTPTSAIGYPYPLSYIHGLHNTSPATSLLRGSEAINNSTAISSAINPTMPPTSISTTTAKADRNHVVAGFPVKDSQGQDFKHLTGLPSPLPSLSATKAASLLPQSYIPNMLSPSIRYSPYGFPFF